MPTAPAPGATDRGRCCAELALTDRQQRACRRSLARRRAPGDRSSKLAARSPPPACQGAFWTRAQGELPGRVVGAAARASRRWAVPRADRFTFFVPVSGEEETSAYMKRATMTGAFRTGW
eukprot:scaffold1243_cov403-Prasinococcus_capsulatus_cf.AAC.26